MFTEQDRNEGVSRKFNTGFFYIAIYLISTKKVGDLALFKNK